MGTNFSRGQFRGGLPTGAKLKKSKIRFPGTWQGFAQWLLQVVEVRDKYGIEIAEKFVEESDRRYAMSSEEKDYALSIARTK